MTDNKKSFIFYDSFLNALDELDSEIELEVYRAITHYALRNEEPNLTGIAKAIFSLIQPQIDANNERYENGKKGGRPKTNGFENKKPMVLKKEENKKPNVNVNVNENVNENVNVNVNENENVNDLGFSKKQIDPFLNSTKNYVQEEYKKVFGAYPNLLYSECNKICELQAEVENFKHTVPTVFERLKTIKWEFKDGTKKPDIHWLLKDNNYVKVLDGAFEVKDEWQEFLAEQRRLEDERTNKC